MRRLIIIFLSFLTLSLPAQQRDSSALAALGLKLSEYYETLKHEPIDVQKRECDFLIESATDSLVRQYIALDIYEHYMDSPLMGSENVAVHVFDKWFSAGKVRMRSNSDFIEAQIYADFNRSSLIGEKVLPLRLETLDGIIVELFGERDVDGVFKVLYFYDTDCSKCRLETLLLNGVFSSKDYPVRLYAVYAGDDRQAWQKYVNEHLAINGACHFWDPDLDSDFQRKYGVTSTPRLFLIAPDGTVLGRGLDAEALAFMLAEVFSEKPLTYGSRESEALFDGIFSMSDGNPSIGEVKGIADYIHDRTISSGDTLMYRQMAGDYLYYLASRSGEGVKEGLKYHIDTYILSDNKVWTSQDDSLKIIGFAEIMGDLLSKAVPGSDVPAMKVPGELYTLRGVKNVRKRLDRFKGKENIIIFYTEGCEICAEEKKAALELLSAAKDVSLPKHERKAAGETKVFMVNVDSLMQSDPSLASKLMDSFDLSSLPFILKTDQRGTILRRYLTLV